MIALCTCFILVENHQQCTYTAPELRRKHGKHDFESNTLAITPATTYCQRLILLSVRQRNCDQECVYSLILLILIAAAEAVGIVELERECLGLEFSHCGSLPFADFSKNLTLPETSVFVVMNSERCSEYSCC